MKRRVLVEVQYDAKRDEKEQHEAKMKEVRKVEELRKEKEAESKSIVDEIVRQYFVLSREENADANQKANDTFVERMQLQVIRNLELSIRNVHIVYEDRSTKPHHPFAFGITLNYITLHVTKSSDRHFSSHRRIDAFSDDHGRLAADHVERRHAVDPQSKPIDRSDGGEEENVRFAFVQLGELSALSVYWITNAKSRSSLPRAEAIVRREKTSSNEILCFGF